MKPTTPEQPESCPCGSDRTFLSCCHPILHNKTAAANPEALMRSRYVAYLLCNSEYLIKTTHPDTNSEHELEDIAASFQDCRWQSLQVIASSHSGNEATVEFVAFFIHIQQPGQICQLHEKSVFKIHSGQWYYHSGDHLAAIKLGRNSTCWCGSKKKMKHCHPNN